MPLTVVMIDRERELSTRSLNEMNDFSGIGRAKEGKNHRVMYTSVRVM